MQYLGRSFSFFRALGLGLRDFECLSWSSLRLFCLKSKHSVWAIGSIGGIGFVAYFLNNLFLGVFEGPRPILREFARFLCALGNLYELYCLFFEQLGFCVSGGKTFSFV